MDFGTTYLDASMDRAVIAMVSKPNERDEIEKLFTATEETLAKYSISQDWHFVMPDAPTVEVVIEIGARKLRLASSEYPKRLLARGGVASGNDPVPARRMPADQQYHDGFEELANLIVQHLARNVLHASQ